LIPEVDLQGRVIYFPVRHHSPACAWHVSRLIGAARPDVVLVEGPRDATPLIPLLTHPRTRMPVAIFTTFVQRVDPDGSRPLRHSAYYPLCDYSPELAAIRAAAEVGARARFIDLTFPEMVLAGRGGGDARALSLLEDHQLNHSRLLQEACRRTGARDPDDLWDHLYEADFERRDTPGFVRDVSAYCALARRDYTAAMLAAEGITAREAAMAAAVAEESGRVVVVAGGFHTVALPHTAAARPRPVPIAEGDSLVALMRYGFEQLDRLNGYASGMPAPAFYQRTWEGRDVAEVVVELARECRRRRLGTSVADAVAALEQARRLAAFRGHARPTREDLLDGIRSVFIKGTEDVEGVAILAQARKLLAGDRVGDVPPEAGAPPLVTDMRRTAARLRIDLDRVDAREVKLKLYRSASDREASRFFHRLRFLAVPFAEWLGGPDFVTGERLERVEELWRYRWSPPVESTLIERSVYGSTLGEAAAARVLEQFDEAEQSGRGRRADVASELILGACRMGLHRHAQELLDRTGRIVAEDASFVSLVRAIERLLGLHVSREPLEAHHLAGPVELAAAAYDRACYLLPGLADLPEADEAQALDALNALPQAAQTLGDHPGRSALRRGRLRDLIEAGGRSACLRGGAVGLLVAEGQLDPGELVRHLEGHLLSPRDRGRDGADFLRGLLRTARSVLWQVPEVLDSLHDVFRSWDEDQFVRALPGLRLAFADLTPRECDRVAEAAAALAGEGAGAGAGASRIGAVDLSEFTEADLLRGAVVNRRLLDALREDGLEEVYGA
jgi:hypothetical protein